MVNIARDARWGQHTYLGYSYQVVNIARDARWGRVAETYGEDPYLTTALAAALVRGLQGGHPRYLKVAAQLVSHSE